MTRIIKLTPRKRRQQRIRSKVSGTDLRPRLSVYKSNTTMYAQLIDDSKGITIVSASSLKTKAGTKTASARAVGLEVAKLAKAKGVSKIVFDRGGFIYTGRIKALADGAKEGGLEF